jgi:hypothetical protein
MRTFCFYVICLLVSAQEMMAKIMNGYEPAVAEARISLHYLRNVLSTDHNLSREKRRTLSARVQILVNFLACHRLTESLLQQFREISPAIYQQLDSLTDARGRVTDVYVRYMIPRVDQVVYSVACMSLLPEDKDKPVSEFGLQTVSITIWISGQAMPALAHEFGHVYYQVPNLCSYARYYGEHYGVWAADANCKGHEVDDPSGRVAMQFERLFKRDNFGYMRSDAGKTENLSPMVLVQKLKKKIYKESLDQRIAGR